MPLLPAEMVTLSNMPDDVSAAATLLHEVMKRIDQAPNKTKEMKAVVSEFGHMDGYSVANLERKRSKWLRQGKTAVALIDGRSLKKHNKTNVALGECYKEYCENNQRSSRAGYRAMMRDFYNGKTLPYIGSWLDVWNQQRSEPPPQFCPRNWVPVGWKYDNLQRKFKLSKYEAKAVRIGSFAAASEQPAVLTTRAGMLPGQMFMFDDVWHDLEVLYKGEPVRPLELSCIDVYSSYKVGYGIKPRERRDDGKRTNLTEHDMRFLLVHILCTVGYHPDGCTLVVEHGTAAIREWLEKELAIMDPNINVLRSSIIGEQVHKGMFPGKGGGNFKLKASLESLHRLPHFEMAFLPGQTGGDSRNSLPEQLAGLQKFEKDLAMAILKMTPDRAAMLLHEMPSFDHYRDAYSELNIRLQNRDWHQLEGWEADGLHVEEFRIAQTDAFQPISNLNGLDPLERRALLNLARRDPAHLLNVRNLSPREVWQRTEGQMKRLPKIYAPRILGEKTGEILRVSPDGYIHHKNQEINASELVFRATHCLDQHNVRVALNPRQKYLCHVSPFNPTEMYVSDLDSGTVLGIAPAVNAPRKIDQELIMHEVGKVASHKAAQAAPLRRRHEAQAAAKSFKEEHNRKVIAKELPTPKELITAARADGAKGKLSDMFATQDLEEDEEEENNPMPSIGHMFK